MDRCLRLASKGLGYVAPNPLVGCVIVENDTIIAEGYHSQYGKAHAEIEALNACGSNADLSNATLYVNLEPCNHWGKTGPCSHAIVARGIRKVVVGMQDPFNKVNGSGIAYLQNHGVQVQLVKDATRCQYLNRRFVHYVNTQMPYVILKWAQSADGFMGKIGEKTIISGPDAQVLLHTWRSQEAAIGIGKTTFVTDNPQLTNRLVEGNSPKRIVFWGNKLPWNGAEGFEPILHYDLETALKWLGEKCIQSIIIEGGAQLLNAFINQGWFNEVRVFKSKNLHLKEGVKAPNWPMPLLKTHNLEQDEVWEGIRP